MKSTKLQKSIIHALKNKAKIKDEYYRTLIFNLSNGRTDTSKELTTVEANKLIKELGGTPPQSGNGCSRRTQQRRNQKAGVVGLITPAQTTALNALAEARWGVNYGQPLQSLCQRMYRRKSPHTSKQAQSLIEAIKAMQQRDAEKAA